MIEKKVTAATAAATITSFALWAVAYFTHVDVAALPGPVAAAVALAVPGVVTFLAGFLAQHTHRPDITAKGPSVSPAVIAEMDSAPPAMEGGFTGPGADDGVITWPTDPAKLNSGGGSLADQTPTEPAPAPAPAPAAPAAPVASEPVGAVPLTPTV